MTDVVIHERQLADLAIEFWRLQQWIQSNAHEKPSIPLRHYCRKMQQFLADCCIDVVDLVGREYDAGMAVEIVDTTTVITEEASTMIIETVSPIVMRNGQVIRHGKVVTQGPANSTACSENTKEGSFR